MKKEGKIILGGGGTDDQSFVLDTEYFSLLPIHTKILYIPVALNRTSEGFSKCKEWFLNVCKKHNRGDIFVTMLLEQDSIPELYDFDSVYIGGGNTYKLLAYLYNTKLFEKLAPYVQSGGILYGGSAGAIVLGKDIRTVSEENDADYVYTKGCNLLQGKSVRCHFIESQKEFVIEKAKEIGGGIFAIPETSGIIFDVHGSVLKKIGDIFEYEK